MLKKYLEFIKESIEEIEAKHHTLGEWVEDLAVSNEEILELLKPYLDGTNPTVRISSTINTLSDYDQKSVYKIITDYLNDTGREGQITTFVHLVESLNENLEDLKAGKNIFNSFLKVITSLGLKDTEPNWRNMPEDFILIFIYETDSTKLKERFSRFPSLTLFTNRIPENSKLYFGLKNKMEFSFGFIQEEKIIPIGSFQINKSSFKFLQTLESSSANHLKKELSFLNVDKLKLTCNIVKHMKMLHPGDTAERSFKLNNGILEFGYKELAKNTYEIPTIKETFRKHLEGLRGSENLQMSVALIDSWIYCAVKIK